MGRSNIYNKIIRAASAFAGAVNSSPIKNVSIDISSPDRVSITWNPAPPTRQGATVSHYKVFKNGVYAGDSPTNNYIAPVIGQSSEGRIVYSVSAVYNDGSTSRPRSNSVTVPVVPNNRKIFSWGDGKIVGFDQYKKVGTRI